MFIDLDDFKQVNDSQGHAVGDELLREVARRLTNTLRRSDIVCRLGGDEFAVVLNIAIGSSEASHVAAKLLAALALPMQVSGQTLFAGASIGVTVASPGEVDPVEMLRRADVAMYQAKTESKGAYRVFEPTMTVRTSRRALMTQRLRAAVDCGALGLVYQPVVDALEHRILRMEALVRWEDPELGSVSPIEFIRLAEETGTIHAIGQLVLEQSCHDVRWLTQRTGLANSGGGEHLHHAARLTPASPNWSRTPSPRKASPPRCSSSKSPAPDHHRLVSRGRADGPAARPGRSLRAG
jgi:diguanylate cyclase (GGDEF)-like protein